MLRRKIRRFSFFEGFEGLDALVAAIFLIMKGMNVYKMQSMEQQIGAGVDGWRERSPL
ncbi:MAG: hypothetical protein MUF49_13995 [Oculatellaceae cyanobacterium Prado106]|nr:hypothetical protein [Oculatellaceae cyanobacterium Prado106]